MSEAAQEYDTPEGTEASNEPVEGSEPEESGTILDSVEAEAPEDDTEYVNTPEPEPTDEQEAEASEDDSERPEWLPEKFKTPEELVKAYNELGKKVREKNEPPEEYEVKIPTENGELSEADAEAFREMGLSNDQAQQMVDYFYENVVPELQQARADVEKERLASNWGVKADSTEFEQRLAKVKSWAQRNLPEEAVAQMAKTHNGVDALYQMMQNKADTKLNQGGPQAKPSRAELQKLMDDDRYRKGDVDYMEYVRQQFQAAFD